MRRRNLLLALGCILSILVHGQEIPMNYSIDITSKQDTFLISLELEEKLDQSASIFQFASTAPGTYQTMNIGRLVSSFKAFDKKGRELTVSNPNVNQYVIEKVQKVQRITYEVAETFDTELKKYPIYLMCGTSIEEDHALLNVHAILGYFTGYQKSPINMTFTIPDDWKIGTALDSENGTYMANDFDHAVDSPILMGNLTFADTDVAGTKVEIYTYSQNGFFESEKLLSDMSDMLDATKRYLIDLPVDRYTFLYFFEPTPPGITGAWEHSYSSEYVLAEKEPTAEYMRSVTEIASHEFFHIVTPLNIHSEVVESFNFVTPTPSVHLWMYEGVTEWASNILLYRGGVVSEEDYLSTLAQKVRVSESYFDPSWSLKKLSDESFKGGAGAKQYGNIYYKGALVAGMLDIRLLELSNGEFGLREVILDLVKKYGKGKPVSETDFFDDFTSMTFPEIRAFFDRYVLGDDELPHAEYFDKIGIEYFQNNKGAVTLTKKEKMSESQTKLYEAWSKRL